MDSLDFRLLFESAPELYLVLSPDLIILGGSNAYFNATLTKRETVTGKNVFTVFPDNPDTPQANATLNLHDSFQEVIRSRRPHRMAIQHYDIPLPDGGFAERYWSPLNTPVLDAQGVLKYIIHQVSDVTQQILYERRMELKLRESEYLVQKMADTGPGMISVINLRTGAYLYVNKGIQKLLGYRPEDFLLGGFAFVISLVHPDDVVYLEERNRKMMQLSDDNAVIELEYRMRHRNGKYIWMHSYAVIFHRNGQSEVEEVLVISFDVSESKAAEEELVRSNQIKAAHQRLLKVLETIPQMAWTARPDGYIFYFNRRWFEYTGQSPEEAKGEGWKSVLHPEDLTGSAHKYSHAIITGEAYVQENRFRRASDMAWRWHLTRAVPIRNEEGEILLWVGTCTDTHDLKNALEDLKENKEELDRKNKELVKINNDLDNFIYTASHDLKAPVSNIEGLITSLNETLPRECLNETEDAKILLTMMEASVKKFKGTISDLTEISKIQKGAGADIEFIDCREVIEDVKQSIDELIVVSKAKIDTDTSGCNEFEFSRKNFKSIIYNLLSNAVKYSSPERRPEILVRMERDQQHLVITVSDNGLGMDLKKHPNIFAMFRRMHDHVEGSGIGLYLVKRIVDNAGGKIEVTSEVGRGSTFKVFLPVK